MKKINIDSIFLEKPLIIAGPCSVESREQINDISSQLSAQGIKFLRGGAFKPRTSPGSFQGIGSDGIRYLREAADKNDMFVVSEVLDSDQLDLHYDDIDVIQIGSRNMSSYGLLKTIGKKSVGDQKPVLLKRGFSSTINELLLAAEYITNEGNPNVWLCLRGIRTFEQIDSIFRFTPDLAGIIELKEKTDLPVIFDPSHSTGDAKYVIQISKAAISLGVDGLLIESHTTPETAMTDGKQCVLPQDISQLLK